MTAPIDPDIRTMSYATHATDRARPAFLVQSWLACIAAMLFCGGAAVFVVIDRQWFRQIFADFHLKLPSVAQVVVDLPGFVIIGLGVTTIGVLLAVQLAWRNKYTATVLHVLAIACWCVAVLVYRESMWGVFLNLMEGMTGGGRRSP